ncbi:MAG: DUF4097 domain-containing protein [bacterium]
MRFKILCISGLLLFQGSVLAGTHRETFEQTYPMRTGGKVVVSNTNGEVVVDTWERDEVRVVAEKVVRAGSSREAREIMERVRIHIKHEDDFLEIETDYPRFHDGFWNALFGRGINVTVSYRITAPRELDLHVSTVNGKIRVSDLRGKIGAHSTNGSIRIIESRGQIEAKTTNGRIEAELVDYDQDEDMYFKTTNGGIEVSFPRDFRAYIEARTTNGRVRTDFPMKVKGEMSRRKIRGEINGGGGRIVLHTTNGGIRILEGG